MDDATERELTGGTVNDVVRRGDTVRRSAGPWTPTVQALLAWVRAQGVSFVPAPLGLDEQGREVLGRRPATTCGSTRRSTGGTSGACRGGEGWLPVPHQQGAEMRHRLPLTLDANWTSVQ